MSACNTPMPSYPWVRIRITFNPWEDSPSRIIKACFKLWCSFLINELLKRKISSYFVRAATEAASASWFGCDFRNDSSVILNQAAWPGSKYRSNWLDTLPGAMNHQPSESRYPPSWTSRNGTTSYLAQLTRHTGARHVPRRRGQQALWLTRRRGRAPDGRPAGAAGWRAARARPAEARWRCARARAASPARTTAGCGTVPWTTAAPSLSAPSSA